MKKQILIALVILAAMPTAAAQTTGPSVQLEAQLLNTDPFPVQAGEDADVQIAIRNTGDSKAENVTVRLQDSFPFQVKPDRKQEYSIGSITPGEKYYISTDVLVAENAPDGQNNFKVVLENGDISVTKDVPIETTNNQVDFNLANLQTSPADLKPGTDNAELTVDVANNGEKTAENVVLDIELPFGLEPVSSLSTRHAMGNVQPGQVKSTTFRFDVNDSASKGRVDFPAAVSYGMNDSVQTQTEEIDFSIFLTGAPQYEVKNVESDLSIGRQGEVRIKVQNTGDVESESTRIRVLDNADLPFSYTSSSAFIGTLQPGQNGTAVFDVTVENSADAKDHLVDFETRGVNGQEVFVEDTTLRLGVQESANQSGGIGNTGLAAAIGAFILVAGIVVFLFRDRLGL
jgi:hypothetical protein